MYIFAKIKNRKYDLINKLINKKRMLLFLYPKSGKFLNVIQEYKVDAHATAWAKLVCITWLTRASDVNELQPTFFFVTNSKTKL